MTWYSGLLNDDRGSKARNGLYSQVVRFANLDDKIAR